MSNDRDVVIVGAGPAGSTAATVLARRGRNVLLLDRAEFPRDKACGDGVPPGTVGILHDLGITIVGDFIVSPDYDDARFAALEGYVTSRAIELPILTVLTPLPGTPLHDEMQKRITIRDLDYYTLTNAVIPTRLGEKRFYQQYARLITSFHANAKL